MTKLTTRQRDKLIEAGQAAIPFTVQGTGQFPTDMLRYDLCWPASSTDSNRLDTLPYVQGGGKEIVQVNLKGLKVPTAARWASFGWRVVESCPA